MVGSPRRPTVSRSFTIDVYYGDRGVSRVIRTGERGLFNKVPM